MNREEIIGLLAIRFDDIPEWVFKSYLDELQKRKVNEPFNKWYWINTQVYFRIASMLAKMGVLNVHYEYDCIGYDKISDIPFEITDDIVKNDEILNNIYVSYSLKIEIM